MVRVAFTLAKAPQTSIARLWMSSPSLRPAGDPTSEWFTMTFHQSNKDEAEETFQGYLEILWQAKERLKAWVALFGHRRDGQMSKCPDCDDDDLFDRSCGNGKCGECHGTGVNPNLASVALGEEECPECGESGVCQTCDGSGEV